MRNLLYLIIYFFWSDSRRQRVFFDQSAQMMASHSDASAGRDKLGLKAFFNSTSVQQSSCELCISLPQRNNSRLYIELSVTTVAFLSGLIAAFPAGKVAELLPLKASLTQRQL